MRECACEECDKKFEPRDERQRYCSEKCNNRQWYLRKLRRLGKMNCISCGKLFQVTKKGRVKCQECANRERELVGYNGYIDKQALHPTVSAKNKFLLLPLN